MATIICKDFVAGKCTRESCKFPHVEVCKHFWHHGECRYGNTCKHIHETRQEKSTSIRPRRKHVKNTESFNPLNRPVDMRIVFDLGTHNGTLTTPIHSRDVVLVPNLFSDFESGELYKRLENEITQCGVPQDKLLKLWHGDTHYIADDHTHWKRNAPTFSLVIERIRSFFKMNIQATRFNWYKDTSQWKPFHRDAAAIKEDKAATQNFTVAVSFGATREAAFEEMKNKVVISIPQPDGCIYCFAKDTNILWMHGILQEKVVREEGRISIICWGSVDQSYL